MCQSRHRYVDDVGWGLNRFSNNRRPVREKEDRAFLIRVATVSPLVVPPVVRADQDEPVFVGVCGASLDRRNEPAHVVYTAECLAEVRGIPPEQFARQTTTNARRLFAIK